MCGITGYIGNEWAAPILLRSLKKLEYRGYDSSGLAVLHNDRIILRKKKGRISALEDSIGNEKIPGTAGIAHTRWATHGEPSDKNAHPQISENGNIAVVHNGIIENYAKLKLWLEERGVTFSSDTDTEVVAQLINYFYEKTSHNLIFESVLKAVQKLEGTYALGIICANSPDKIIALRKDNPLVIGLSGGANFIASDVPAILANTRDVYFLNDGEIAVLYRDHVDVFNEQGKPVKIKPTHINWEIESAEKGGYPHFMLKEIDEQPKAITDTLRHRIKIANNKNNIDFDDIKISRNWAQTKRIVITACGTAYHAAVIGKYAFEHFARIHTEVDIASEYRYRNPICDKNDIFIVISQSGETADTLAAMRSAKKNGTCILAITNTVGSTLSREADFVLYTRAGQEIAVASTKAFTTQMICIYLLAIKFAHLRSLITEDVYTQYINDLLKIPDCVKKVLDKKEIVQKFAAENFNKTKVFYMGRLFDYAISMESALKLKEISYTHSEAFAAGELKHGTIALVDDGTLVVAFATQRNLFDKIASNIHEVTSRGATTLVITYNGVTRFDNICSEVIHIPQTKDFFSPLVSIVPAQLFAYYCAVKRGLDPDKPRNLAKSVTVE